MTLARESAQKALEEASALLLVATYTLNSAETEEEFEIAAEAVRLALAAQQKAFDKALTATAADIMGLR